MELRYGSSAHYKPWDRGQVIEVDTRTSVVRYEKADGELIEHRFAPEDLEYRPKPHLQ